MSKTQQIESLIKEVLNRLRQERTQKEQMESHSEEEGSSLNIDNTCTQHTV